MRVELDFLTGLDHAQLHLEGCKRSIKLAGAEWDMAVCLLAIEKARTYWAMGYSSTVQYLVVELKMGGHKASELLRVGRTLQSLPLMSDAFRNGHMCWSKLREITRVVTPETKAAWLQFACHHSADQVARAVTMSPRRYHEVTDKSAKPTPTSQAAEPVQDVDVENGAAANWRQAQDVHAGCGAVDDRRQAHQDVHVTSGAVADPREVHQTFHVESLAAAEPQAKPPVRITLRHKRAAAAQATHSSSAATTGPRTSEWPL